MITRLLAWQLLVARIAESVASSQGQAHTFCERLKLVGALATYLSPSD